MNKIITDTRTKTTTIFFTPEEVIEALKFRGHGVPDKCQLKVIYEDEDYDYGSTEREILPLKLMVEWTETSTEIEDDRKKSKKK